ncbi:MAG: dynamin family protein [Prevotella koreensis]|uniref:dynamin family protein n=1 Tax=Prevotella koreensis TaxID=2490854 RepID=UPI003FA07541
MNREELINIIQNSETKLNNLRNIDYDGLKERITELESIFKEFKEGGESLLSKENTLQIGIVGQVKAGKSSFLNSLFFNGENVLPKASTPMTAGLTVIEYAEKNTFEVEYFDEKDWQIFVKQNEDYKKCEQEVRAKNPNQPEIFIKKEIEKITSDKIRSAHELVSACSSNAKDKIGRKNDAKEFKNLDELQNVLEQYVGANGEYTSVVKSLYIKMNDERLDGLRIVDTPGVNDPVVSRENRTRTFLHSCHGVFLLSAATDFLGSGDISFLNSRIGGSGIGTVVLLASKFDSVLQDIGADRVMKKQEHGDLFDTVNEQKKKFKKRLRELSNTIDEKLRNRIKLDTTAGIGYSIANKPSSKWDNLEKQIVQQMKRYYPNYFSTEDDIQESFEGLANIPDIRKEYLEGVFMKNKDSIIAEKIKEFFAKNKQDISSSIDQMLQEFKNHQEQLNKTTVAEIQKQNEQQSELFDNLKSKFDEVFLGFNKSIQHNVTEIANNIRFNYIKEIPTEKKSIPIRHKGIFYGHTTSDIEMTQVNTYELKCQVEENIESYVQSWNNEWKKMFDETRKEMADKLIEAISDFEKEIMSTSFNDKYYRDLIERTLNNLKYYNVLELRNIIDKNKNNGFDKIEEFVPDETENKDKDEVKPHLDKKIKEHNKELIKGLRSNGDSLKEDVKKEISINLKNANNEIEKTQSSFIEKLKKEGKKYLDNLEKEMSEKTVVIKKIENIISCISELSTIYK